MCCFIPCRFELGLVGSSAITSGTWAVKLGEIVTGLGRIAAIGPGAPIAVLVMGMMPGRLNDGEQDYLDRMRLEQMRDAPTRVRYSWEQDDKGNLFPRGWHTPPGKDRVRVRKMAWDSSRKAYTFTTEEDPRITLIWTPDSSGVNVPTNTGNPYPVRITNPVVVDPLPEDSSIDATTTPAPEEKNFADYILILPLSDIRPIYVYLSKRLEDPIWTLIGKITKVENAYNHRKKHSLDFPELANSKEYVDATHDFVNNLPEGKITKIRSNGDILYIILKVILWG